MLGKTREEQLMQAVEAGLIPCHIANALRTESPISEGEADRTCTAISEGYEDCNCQYKELYEYILYYAEING